MVLHAGIGAPGQNLWEEVALGGYPLQCFSEGGGGLLWFSRGKGYFSSEKALLRRAELWEFFRKLLKRCGSLLDLSGFYAGGNQAQQGILEQLLAFARSIFVIIVKENGLLVGSVFKGFVAHEF